ncbi:MAG TPA: T9SS type A sorting domain-containing protein [Bacteroidetes bacterium]|nr:T9SS type A sorting domain-containing protein [Bacteroidota bacterium]
MVSAYVRLGKTAGPVTLGAFLLDLPEKEVSFHFTALPDTAYRLVRGFGNDQGGVAGQVLAEPLVVEVQDAYGNPVQGYPVEFVVTLGDGQVIEAQPVISGADGRAQVTFRLGKTAEENRVEARAPGLAGSPVEFVERATGGIAREIRLAGGNNQSGPVGQPLPQPLEVEVVDGQGSPVADYWVHFENRSELGGSLSADSAKTGADGRASVSFTLGTKVGTYQVVALANGLQGSPVTFNLTAVAGPAARMAKVSGDSTVGIILEPLPEPFVVRVVDQYGNAVAGEPVTFTVTAGDGHLQGDGTQMVVQTAADGTARATLVLGSLTGNFNNRVQAERAGLAGSPVVFVASALPPSATRLALYSGDGQMGFAGSALPQPLQVKVTNAVGEPVKNHPVRFYVQEGGGRFVENQDTVLTVATDNQGIASATLICGPYAGPDVNLVRAESYVGDTPLIGSPVYFKISARYTGAKLLIRSGNNQVGMIGTELPLPLEVQVLDSLGQAARNQPVTFRVLSGGGHFATGDTVVTRVTNLFGRVSVRFTLGPVSGPNSQVVQATATDGFHPLENSPLFFYASATLTSATTLQKVRGDQQTATVNQVLPQPVEVKVTDADGAAVAGQQVEFRILSGGGRIVGAPQDTLLIQQTDSNGLASVQWQLGIRAGRTNNRLQVRADNGVQELDSSPVIFTAVALPDITDPDSSRVLATSPVVANGQDRSTVTVILKDRYGNPVPDARVEISVSGTKNFVTQPLYTTDSSGVAVGYVASIAPGTKLIYAKDLDHNVVLSTPAEVRFLADQARRATLFAGNEQRRNVGTLLQNPLVVLITDNFDNPVPDYPVTFRAKTEGGYILEDQHVRTDSLGLASVHYVLSETPGINTIEADAGDLTGSPVIFLETGEENPPHRLLYVSGGNQTATVGKLPDDSLTVRVVDQAGNPVKNVAVTFSVTFGGGEVVTPQPVKTDYLGLARAQVRCGTELVTQVVSASAEGLVGSPVTFLIDTRPDAPHQIEIASGGAQEVPLQASSQPLTVRVRDRYGNPVPQAAVHFEVVAGEGTVVTSQPVLTGPSGLASATVRTGTQAGRLVVKAWLSARPEASVRFELSVLPGEPAFLSIHSGDGQRGTTGMLLPLPLRAIIRDAYGNPVPGQPVNFVVTKGDASIVGDGTKYTDEEGIASCYLQIGSATGRIEVYAVSPKIPNAVLIFRLTAVQNQPPVMDDIADQRISERETLELILHGVDPDGDSLIASAEPMPRGAAISQLDSASWKFSWTPDFDQAGEYRVIFMLRDTDGGFAADTVTITVLNVNRPPVITYFSPPRDTSLVTGQSLWLELRASDPDGDPLRFFWTRNGQPVADSSAYEYSPGPDFTGQDLIVGYATDGTDTVQHRWIITVKTAVELVDFRAVADLERNTITLIWQTAAERNTAGFEVWRSTRPGDGFALLTEKLIPAQGKGVYQFTDDGVEAGIRYYYKLADVSATGRRAEHGPVAAEIALPLKFSLSQSFPNPLSLRHGAGVAVIKLEIPKPVHARVRIFNLLGQTVRELVNRQLAPGRYEITWNGRDSQGNLVSSGVYFYELRAGNFKAIRRMVLLR